MNRDDPVPRTFSPIQAPPRVSWGRLYSFERTRFGLGRISPLQLLTSIRKLTDDYSVGLAKGEGAHEIRKGRAFAFDRQFCSRRILHQRIYPGNRLHNGNGRHSGDVLPYGLCRKHDADVRLRIRIYRRGVLRHGLRGGRQQRQRLRHRFRGRSFLQRRLRPGRERQMRNGDKRQQMQLRLIRRMTAPGRRRAGADVFS